MHPTPHDWPSFFETVRHRPGMYLGGKSVKRLGAYIAGFAMAEHLHYVEESKRFGNFDHERFQLFVSAKFGHVSAFSYELALRSADSDEAAFDVWFGWYDEFRAL